MIGVSILIQALLLAVLTGIIYRRYFHPLAVYPGPLRASRISGTHFLKILIPIWMIERHGTKNTQRKENRRFSVFFTGNHHLIEKSLHDTYGPIVRTGPNSLSFSSLAAFTTIYGFNGHFEKGSFYSFGRDDNLENGSIFTARTDAAHRERRKQVVGPALTTSKISAYEGAVKKHTAYLIVQLESKEDVKSTDVPDLIHRFTFNTMLEIIYGSQLSPEPYTNLPAANMVLDSFKAILKFSIGTALLPWFRWVMSFSFIQAKIRKPTHNQDGTMNGIAALGARTHTLVLNEPTQVLNSHQPCIAQNYIQFPIEDTRAMSPQQTWRESFNLVFAGPGSTAAALTAILYELASHGQWQEKIVSDEKDTLLAVIKESIRLHAPFPTAFPRDITSGAESAIPGLKAPLPIGTLVGANTFVLGRSKEIWGPDADEWKPERWIVGDDRKEKEKWLDERFVGFSKGARGCIGKEIAMMVLCDATLAVLRRFRLEKTGELKGSSFLEMQYTEAGIGFVDR